MGNHITTLAPPARCIRVSSSEPAPSMATAMVGQLMQALNQLNTKVNALAVQQAQVPARQTMAAPVQQVTVARVEQDTEVEVDRNRLLEFFD